MFLLLLFLVSLPSRADSVRIFENRFNWDNPDEVTVSDGELLFGDAYSGHFQNRVFHFSGYLNRGYLFTVMVFRWIYSFAGAWGLYVLVAGPDGRTFVHEDQIKGRDLTVSEDHLYIRFGGSVIEGSGEHYHIRLDLKGFSCDLRIRSILPSWKPGDGFAYLTAEEDVYMRFGLNAPWASVAGTLCLYGTTLWVEGQCSGECRLSVLPLNRQNSPIIASWFFSPSVIPADERFFLGMWRSVTNSSYGSKPVSVLALASGDRWLFTTDRYTLEPIDFSYFEHTPYAYPVRFKVNAEKKGMMLNGELTCARPYWINDIFQKLPMVFRLIVSAFLKRPVLFHLPAAFQGTVTMPDGAAWQLRLQGQCEYTIIR